MLNKIKFSVFGAELLLILAAVVWGFSFVAQKIGMDSIGPMAFNGIRFIIGSLSLLPVILIFNNKKKKTIDKQNVELWKAGIISGTVLFIAASIQQFGIVFTTAGNAGFITSIYVIIVPVMGLLFKQKVTIQTWVGAVLAIVGLYYLSASEGLTIVIGDLLVFGSAFFWAIQVLLAGYYAVRVNVIKLAAIQFALTGVVSLIISLFTETYGIQNILDASIPILYGGLMSVGLAFTIQLIAQKKANPSHAAIILSTESVFAAVGGWIILNERLTTIEFIGAVLMLTGVVISQLKKKKSYYPKLY
ncbi:MAG: DMT family transporter [Bacteroidetes bacterium]|nr:DMT family transporter [Bacteroidota bacterium]